MTGLVLTPFTAGEAVELGNRMWRKKVLPVGDVEYKGRTLHFTLDYLKGLARAFTDRAYDQVAFQLADAANTHTNDPERFRGEVVGMNAEPDGLWLTMSPTDAGDQVLRENPNLGISARIVEDYDRSDGQHFTAAIQHVLGTLDPRIPGLGPWQAIEAATPAPDTVTDLSGYSFTSTDAPPGDPAPAPVPSPPSGRTDMDLTTEQQARLEKLLGLPDEALDALAAGGTVLSPEELAALTSPGDEDGDLAAEIDAMSDEELAALEAAFEAEEGGGEGGEFLPDAEPASAGLSAEAQFSIDLANARAEETAREMAVISARLREQDYQAEKRRLADLGVPPFITELARPLLEGAGRTVELANGKTADAGQVMRKVLTEFARQARLLDLDVELGSPMDEPDDAGSEQAASDREALVTRIKSATGLGR